MDFDKAIERLKWSWYGYDFELEARHAWATAAVNVGIIIYKVTSKTSGHWTLRLVVFTDETWHLGDTILELGDTE